MAKDPAFLFYPGDYLRDTQCLSEKSQVAYDRIMCEHMRNISNDVSNIAISKDKVDFFTKRLTDTEKEEIFHVLTRIGDRFQIDWVAVSISKRKHYSDSRSENRMKGINKHMKTYVSHMENENEIVNENKVKDRIGGAGERKEYKNEEDLVSDMLGRWLNNNSDYPISEKKDKQACLQIAYEIADYNKWEQKSVLNGNMISFMDYWDRFIIYIHLHDFYSKLSLQSIQKQLQKIITNFNADGKKKKRNNPNSGSSSQADGSDFTPL